MIDAKKALNLVAGLCSNKECCSRDIREKLLKWEIPEQEIARILEFLYKNKFLDDNRFATFYARDKFRFNKWGKQKISVMLQQKGLSSEIISQALSLLDENEYENNCLALMQQKLKMIKETDPYKIKAKLIRFTLGRGFSYDTINRCMAKIDTFEF